MTKAFDLADLVARLKANGIVLAEKEAKDATACMLDWASDSCVLEGGALGAIAPPVVLLLKPLIIQLEDKIDGIQGN